MKYLLDTNVLVRILRGHAVVRARFAEVGPGSCAVSIVTAAELYLGAQLSTAPADNYLAVDDLLAYVTILPVAPVVREFARQKARLRRAGQLIEDFDLLIGVTVVVHDLRLVTSNDRHLARVEGVALEDWGR